MTRFVFLLFAALLSSLFSPSARAQDPGEIDSTYAVDGMNTFWLEIDGTVRGLQILDIHMLPGGELLAVGNMKTGCSGTWTIQGIIVKIDENGFLDSTYYGQGYHVFDTSGLLRILPAAGQDYFLVSSSHIIKIQADGSLDSSFGDEGYLETDFTIINAEMDNNGNIVAAGRVYNYSPVGSDYDYFLSRFDQNGLQDLSFGTNGLAYPVDTLGDQNFTNIAIDSQGRIVSSGRATFSQNDYHLLAARTMPDGTPDASFGEDGLFIESYSNRSRGNTIHIDANDNVIVAGNAKLSTFGNWGVFMLKFNADGSMDTDFGDEGFKYKEIPGDAVPNKVHRLADGSLLVTGSAFSEFIYMAKFQPSGDADGTFGDDGVVVIDAFEFSGSATDSELLGNSVIIAANSFLSDCAQSKWKAVFTKYKIDGSAVAIVANTPDDISICTASPTAGSATVNLESNLDQIVGGQTGVTVAFFNNEEDAENDLNAIQNPDAHEIDAETQLIFVRVESITDEDQFGITSFFVHVSSPSEITPPAPLQVCDDDFDGFAVFDLSLAGDEILGEIENAVLAYFPTPEAAFSGNVNEQIEASYTNQTASPDTVWIRVLEPNGCTSVTHAELLVNPLPQASLANATLSLCDLNGETALEIDLTAAVSVLLENPITDSFGIHFFLSQSDAQQNTAAIESPESHELEEPSQSIYLGIENTATGCYAPIAEPLEILLHALPDTDSAVSDYSLCDADFDGDASFDLTTRIPQILNDQDALVYQAYFFTSETDAAQNSNSIENADSYVSVSANQTIYAGILNSETGCYAGGNQSFELSVLVQPQIAQEPDTLRFPTLDGNDEAVFDLTQNNSLMLGSQDASAFFFLYYESQEDAANGTNPIENPGQYTNFSNPQTIHAGMYSSDSACVSYTSFQLLVEDVLATGDELFGDGIAVFPNPAADVVWIEGRDPTVSTFSIRNLRGAEVMASGPHFNQRSIAVDVSQLPAGVYILNIRSQHGHVVNRKLVIL